LEEGDAMGWHLTEIGRWVLWAKEALDQGNTRRAKLLLLDADAAITLRAEDPSAEGVEKLLDLEEKVHRALEALNRGDLERAKAFLAEADRATRGLAGS